MEKIFTRVANTGLRFEETYTFRIHATKAMLLEQLSQTTPFRWVPNLESISFQHGIMANVQNHHFELHVLPDLAGVEVFYSDSLAFNAFGIHVSAMTLSVLTDGNTNFEAPMTAVRRSSDNGIVSPWGHRYLHLYFVPLRPVSVEASSVPVSELNEHNWPDSANEFKIDISILQITQAEFLDSRRAMTTALSLAADNSKKLNVSKYFLSTTFSDAKVSCEGQDFPVHIFILSHNSPVFAKTFENDFIESKEKCVEIRDTDANTVQEMLRYFYTGEVQNLEEISKPLYELADRYMVDDLKPLCIRSLIQSVNMENALDMYHFGCTHEIQLLKLKAEEVLVEYKEEIVKDISDLQELLRGLPSSMATDLFNLLWKK